jgi:hypothetical protein
MHSFVMIRGKILAFAFFTAASAFLAGCNSGPQRAGPVDVELARESLRMALDSWKRGEPPDALRDGSPSITAQDMDWKAGYALVAYEIRGDEREDAANLHCPVQLTLRDQQGREVKKQVTYVIGTDPVITVFREMSL